MPAPTASDAPRDELPAGLPEQISAAMREALPLVAEQTIAAVTAEVPGYERALSGAEGQNLTRAVELALRGFLSLASGHDGADPSSPLAPALDGAYALGRGEARSGRSMDALLAAYRVGARVAWRELGGVAVANGLPADEVVQFAELVFAYIDQLSAASVSGHSDQLATTGRVRERYLDALGRALLAGASQQALTAAAERADWDPPERMVAIIIAGSQVPAVRMRVDQRALQLLEDVPGLDPGLNLAVLLVPVLADRAKLLATLRDSSCLVGPARDWLAVGESFDRALRALRLGLAPAQPGGGGGGQQGGPVDTDEHLPELVVGADPAALADLRARALAPLQELPPATVAKLSETLGSWLRHQGRRDEVAAEIFVHPQTVRYRMGQIRAAYGSALEDPRTILELTIALGVR